MAVAAVLLVTSANAREPARPDLAQVEKRIVEATNALRASHGRGALAAERRLENAARDFAAFMARTGKFDHDADGRQPAQRIAASGYRYCMVAENIAYEFDTRGFSTAALATRFVDDWKGSAGHRANMLNGGAVHTAVAVVRSNKTGYYYAVQLFGSPRSGARC
jgi:uncharacterized protein YkwD